MTTTIAIVNDKGGVGKTTCTVSLGGAYAQAGKNTLLIDLDPQASLTRGLIGDADTDVLPPATTAAALFGDAVVPLARLILPTRFERLSLLPATRDLSEYNYPDRQGPAGASVYAVRDLDLSEYDRVLIDCPPNIYFLSWCAMAAADYVLTPTRSDPYGFQALRFVNGVVANMRAAGNPNLAQLGYLLSVHKARNAVHISYASRIKRDFGALLFANVIPDAAIFAEAADAETPVTIYRPRNAAAKAVAVVVQEIEARISLTSKEAA